MLPDVNKTSKRRQIVFCANTAQTPEEIRYVRDAVDAWLRRDPDDEIVKRAARMLDRAEDRLRQAGE
jgi:hypothetical protein